MKKIGNTNRDDCIIHESAFWNVFNVCMRKGHHSDVPIIHISTNQDLFIRNEAMQRSSFSEI